MRGRVPGSHWWIVAAAVAMQLALGGVNAWSVFRDPFVDAFGWSIADVTWAYLINVVMFGLSAFVGGLCTARIEATQNWPHEFWMKVRRGKVPAGSAPGEFHQTYRRVS